MPYCFLFLLKSSRYIISVEPFLLAQVKPSFVKRSINVNTHVVALILQKTQYYFLWFSRNVSMLLTSISLFHCKFWCWHHILLFFSNISKIIFKNMCTFLILISSIRISHLLICYFLTSMNFSTYNWCFLLSSDFHLMGFVRYLLLPVFVC